MPKQYAHDDLSAKGLAWIHSRATASDLRSGFEVALAEGYVADAAALGWWQARHCEEHGVYGPTIRVQDEKGSRPEHDRYPKVPSLLFVIEAKASRSDFLSTFNGSEHHANRRAPVGSLHWCVANEGVCDASELPGFWGLLTPRGRGLVEAKKPIYCEDAETTEHVYRCAYILLWKREWRGRMFDSLNILAAETLRAEEAR